MSNEEKGRLQVRMLPGEAKGRGTELPNPGSSIHESGTVAENEARAGKCGTDFVVARTIQIIL